MGANGEEAGEEVEEVDSHKATKEANGGGLTIGRMDHSRWMESQSKIGWNQTNMMSSSCHSYSIGVV